MPRNLIWSWMAALLLVLSANPQPIQAQTNLLNDPGFEFEGVWKNVITADDDSASFNVAPAWNGWLTQTPSVESWQNIIPNGYPHSKRFEGDEFVRSGNRSQNIARGFGTFTAAVYQTVAVEEGTNLIGSAYVVMNIPGGANSQARVGIDPNGGNSPFDSDIVWSAWGTNIIGQMRQLTTQATATGPTVTLWLYATQTTPTDPNGVFWDDASLIVGGAGGGVEGEEGDEGGEGDTPQEVAPPAVAPFVQAQGSQDDGSIIHTVQSGDTLDAIAVAYGVPTAEIIELNDLTNPRFLQIGQQLIIVPPGAGASDDDDADDEDADATEEPVAGDEEPSADDEDATEEPAADDEESAADDEESAADDEDAAEEDVTPTRTPRPSTPTPAPTAPVAVADAGDDDTDPNATTGAICVLMFEDANMNRLQDQDEVPLAGGTITLAQAADEVGSFVSDDTGAPFCFDDLEPGEYTASALPPPNFGLTTPTQLVVRVQSSVEITVQFGAAAGVEVAQAPPPDTGDLAEEAASEPEPDAEEDNPILQNLGLVLFAFAGATLLGGTALAVLLRRR